MQKKLFLSEFPGHTMEDLHALAHSLSQERRMYGGGDGPENVLASCLRRHADIIDAYGLKGGLSVLIAEMAVLADTSPGALEEFAKRVCESRIDHANSLY